MNIFAVRLNELLNEWKCVIKKMNKKAPFACFSLFSQALIFFPIWMNNLLHEYFQLNFELNNFLARFNIKRKKVKTYRPPLIKVGKGWSCYIYFYKRSHTINPAVTCYSQLHKAQKGDTRIFFDSCSQTLKIFLKIESWRTNPTLQEFGRHTSQRKFGRHSSQFEFGDVLLTHCSQIHCYPQLRKGEFTYHSISAIKGNHDIHGQCWDLGSNSDWALEAGLWTGSCHWQLVNLATQITGCWALGLERDWNSKVWCQSRAEQWGLSLAAVEAATLTVASQNSCTLFPFRKKDILGKIFFFLRRTFCCLHFVKCSCFLTNKKWQIWAKSDPESVFSPDVYCVLYIQYPCNIICKTWWVNCKTDSGEPVLRAGAIKVNFRPNPPPAPPPALPIQLQEYKIWYVGTFPHLSKHLKGRRKHFRESHTFWVGNGNIKDDLIPAPRALRVNNLKAQYNLPAMVMVATAKLPPPSPHHLRLSWPGYAKIPNCLLLFHNSWNSEVLYGVHTMDQTSRFLFAL